MNFSVLDFDFCSDDIKNIRRMSYISISLEVALKDTFCNCRMHQIKFRLY